MAVQTRLIFVIVSLGVLLNLLRITRAELSHTYDSVGVGVPLEITEEDLFKFTKFTEFTGEAKDIIPMEAYEDIIPDEGYEDVIPDEVFDDITPEEGLEHMAVITDEVSGVGIPTVGQEEDPTPPATTEVPVPAESSSSLYDGEIVQELLDNGGADVILEGDEDLFDIGMALEAKRNPSGKRIYKKKQGKGKGVSKRQKINSLTSRQEQQILAMHNTYRRRVPGPASNMEEMSWHPGLAKMAKKYSRQCIWEHGNPPNTTPFSHVGQNLAYGSGIKISPMYLVTLWYREKTFYDITTDECQRNAICGHYTQIAWANTKYVGCALNYCRQLYDPLNGLSYPSAIYLVCNYGPGGNVNQHVPYHIGRPCSECGSGLGKCRSGLCSDCDLSESDCQCALFCQNGGTRDSELCKCRCPPGWTGTECQHPCNNTHDWCVKYWPKEWCFKYDDVNPVEQLCPALCGVCECGGPECINGGTKNPETCNCDCVSPWSGSDCSECPLQCVHGTLDAANCHCQCEDGWMGETCSEICENSHQLCYRGWYPNWCDDEHPYVPKYCQAMCGRCTIANGGQLGSDCSLTCYNGGTLDENSCECECRPGWYGEHCTAACEDRFFHCAWSTSMCSSNPDFARNYCPASCGFCQTATLGDINDNTVETV